MINFLYIFVNVTNSTITKKEEKHFIVLPYSFSYFLVFQ